MRFGCWKGIFVSQLGRFQVCLVKFIYEAAFSTQRKKINFAYFFLVFALKGLILGLLEYFPECDLAAEKVFLLVSSGDSKSA